MTSDASTEDVAGVILAGGRSRRMGRDKAFVMLDGKPLLRHVVDRLQPQVAALAINANGDAEKFAPFGLPILPDITRDFAGPLAGILAGMKWAATVANVRWIATVPTDTPFVPPNLVARLQAAAPDGSTILVARSRGADHPVTGLFPLTLRDDLAAWLAAGNDRSVRAWLARHRLAAVDFPDGPGGDPFFNLNAPEDVAAAEAVLPNKKARPT